MISAALTVKKTRKTLMPPAWAARLCVSYRRRDVDRGQTPGLAHHQGAQDRQDHAGGNQREPSGGEIGPGLDRQPTGHLDSHARQGHEPIRQGQITQDRRTQGRVEPELPEPGFGHRRRQAQERQRPQSPRGADSGRSRHGAVGPSGAARPRPTPGP